MALVDPQSVTINAVANSLPRTSFGVNTGAFTKDDGSVKLSVSHAYGKRTRRAVRLDHWKIAPDALTGINARHSMSTTLVIDVPITGYTTAEAKQIVDALVAKLSASTGQLVSDVLGGQV